MANSITGKKIFGAGRPYGINNVTNPTPIQFLVPQSQTITIKRSNKTLHGENQLPDAVGAGEMTVSSKITYGASSSRAMAELFFNQSATAGSLVEHRGEAATISATSPYTVTVADAANFSLDLGVVFVATNQIMTRVAAGSEQAGVSYSVDTTTGKYTFSDGDTGKNVKISYLSKSATVGETLTVSNPLQGKTGNFTGVFVFPWGSEQDIITLNNLLANNTEIGSKGGDFAKPTLDADASTDDNGQLGTFAFAQAA